MVSVQPVWRAKAVQCDLNMFARFLKRSRQKILDRHADANDPFNYLFSGTAFALWRRANRPTRNASQGLVLDAGSGRGAWRHVIAEGGGRRESLDIGSDGPESPDWVEDLTDMPNVPSERFDAVICHQVLEHTPAPAQALSELHRVMKPGGTIVVSVPHLSRRHELPHDYFRFTQEGLNRLMTDAGFDVVELIPYGGILTFLHHQFSTVLLGVLSILFPLYYIGIVVNAPFSILLAYLDPIIDRGGMLANGVIVVGVRRSADAVDRASKPSQ